MECFICKKRLSGRYYVDQWDHKMCEAHMNNDAVYCYSCTCFTKKDITLPDGRILCPVCMANAVKPVDSVAFLTSTVIKTLNKVGFDDLRQEDIKLEIISADKMAQVRKSSVNLQNKGLTLSNVSQSFSLLGGKKQAFNHVIYMLTHLTKNEFAVCWPMKCCMLGRYRTVFQCPLNEQKDSVIWAHIWCISRWQVL